MAYRSVIGMPGYNGEAEDDGTRERRSIFVDKLDYRTTMKQMFDFFSKCGPIRKVTIQRSRPKRPQRCAALIQFYEEGSVNMALIHNGSLFRGKLMTVVAKLPSFPLRM